MESKRYSYQRNQWRFKFSWPTFDNVFFSANLNGVMCLCLWRFGNILVYRVMVRVMVFNATSNNNSAISWRSLLLVEETGGSGENHRPTASHWQTLSYNVVSSPPRHERESNFRGVRHWL